MSAAEISNMTFELPPEERLDLARRLIESVVTSTSSVTKGIHRIEDILSGQTQGLTEAEFRAALS